MVLPRLGIVCSPGVNLAFAVLEKLYLLKSLWASAFVLYGPPKFFPFSDKTLYPLFTFRIMATPPSLTIVTEEAAESITGPNVGHLSKSCSALLGRQRLKQRYLAIRDAIFSSILQKHRGSHVRASHRNKIDELLITENRAGPLEDRITHLVLG